jgi:hypothetical protein
MIEENVRRVFVVSQNENVLHSELVNVGRMIVRQIVAPQIERIVTVVVVFQIDSLNQQQG